jgi:hypothetical protein
MAWQKDALQHQRHQGSALYRGPRRRDRGAVSYNFIYTTVVLDGPATIGGQYRFRMIDASSTIG